MCRTVAYRHSCHHSTLHTVRRCRFTYAVAPNRNPLCSGSRTPSTEVIHIRAPCLACEYHKFNRTWNRRISAARDRLDQARQSLRELDRKTQCTVSSDYDYSWNCCEDVEFADEPSLSELEYQSSSSSSGTLSDCSDDFDEPEVECEDSDWFSFSSSNFTDVRSTSAWEAHNLISQGSAAPKRSSRAVALRARLAAQEKAALHELEKTRDDYEQERSTLWGGYLKSASAKSRPDAVKEAGSRVCGQSPLKQVTNATESADEHGPSRAVSAKDVNAKPAQPFKCLPRRKTDSAIQTCSGPRLEKMTSLSIAETALTSASQAKPAEPRREYQPSVSTKGITNRLVRSCSAESMWVTGSTRIWSLEEGHDESGIALPDYGF